MSWESYVHNLQAGKGQCKFAAILGKNDNSSPWAVWAQSTDKTALPVTDAELVKYATIVAKNDQSVMGSGVELAGIKFACVRFESDILICQGKGDHKEYSLVFANGARTCLVGFNPDGNVKTPAVREAVEVVRDYLKNAGY